MIIGPYRRDALEMTRIYDKYKAAIWSHQKLYLSTGKWHVDCCCCDDCEAVCRWDELVWWKRWIMELVYGKVGGRS